MIGAAFAAGQQPQGAQGPNPLLSLLPFVLLFVVFYFLMIRPSTRRQKDHRAMLKALAKGDRVVTQSGMYGTVVGIDEERDVIVLKIAENVKVEFQRGAVTGVVKE